MLPIFTVGHSNRTYEQFVALLQTSQVSRLVDIRSLPGSRHNPQFARDNLSRSLAVDGIEYSWQPGLGGLRHRQSAAADNSAWRNRSFRNYADYMQTAEFHDALHVVMAMSPPHRLALMCSEAVPWRCHRSLVADALLVRGRVVLEIIGRGVPRPHQLTAFAVVADGRLYYPQQGEFLPPGGE